jgi:hypothetical protein
MAVTFGHFGAMPVLSSRSFGSAFSKFHPGEKAPERALGHCGAEMFARALPLRLVEEDIRPARRTILKG